MERMGVVRLPGKQVRAFYRICKARSRPLRIDAVSMRGPHTRNDKTEPLAHWFNIRCPVSANSECFFM